MIKKHEPALVRKHLQSAKKVGKHHFGKLPSKIEFKPAGKTNFVFELTVSKKKFILRIGATKEKLTDFLKEQWVIEKAMGKNIPVAKVLEVGSDVIQHPYMLQEKLNGGEAIHHENRLDILFEMGAYTKLIHSIPTTGYGSVFDWSRNKRQKNETWKGFLLDEWELHERMRSIRRLKLFDKKKIKKLERAVEKVQKWTESPALNHGDIRLKNVVVNEKGKILAFIDWENSLSAITPCWDLSIALHDLSIDAKQKFLEGYGMDFDAYVECSYAINMFNILNYTPVLEDIVKKKNRTQLEMYKLRLNGYLDLYGV